MSSRLKRYKSYQKKVFLALVSFFLTFCLSFIGAELFIRANYPYRTPDTLRESSLEFEPSLFSRHMLPQMEQTYQELDGTGFATVNDKGYRGDNFDILKPEGVTRIVILGGSGVFDIHAPDHEDWPQLVEDNLVTKGLSNVEVINAGIPGHASWDSVGRLYSEIWQFNPDIILLYNAWNDIKYFCSLSETHSLLREYKPYEISTEYSNRLVGNPFMYYSGPVDEFLSNISQLYVRLRWAYLSWKFGNLSLEGATNTRENANEETLPDNCDETGIQQYELNLKTFVDVANNIDATPILVTQARLVSENNTEVEKDMILYDRTMLSHQGLVSAFEKTDGVIFGIGHSEGIQVIDLSDLNGKIEYFEDQIHTTPQGSREIAKIVSEKLFTLLTK